MSVRQVQAFAEKIKSLSNELFAVLERDGPTDEVLKKYGFGIPVSSDGFVFIRSDAGYHFCFYLCVFLKATTKFRRLEYWFRVDGSNVVSLEGPTHEVPYETVDDLKRETIQFLSRS
jgi:hypothetical protein